MANVMTSPRDLSYVPNNTKPNSTTTSECSKRNYVTVNKNYTHSSNNLMEDNHYTNNFTILHQNVRGLKNKIDEFLISLPQNEPQVICITEHHLQNLFHRSITHQIADRIRTRSQFDI